MSTPHLPRSAPPIVRPAFSFCITCMDRLEHLRRTLPQNLSVADGSDVEFVLLDYNSSDGLPRWVLDALSEPLERGRLVLYRTEEPTSYRSSHAKNVAHRLGEGEVLVNLDADQFLTPEYMAFLRKRFADGRSCVVQGVAKSTGGRVALRREHFFGVGGYDEELEGWGGDDFDLAGRACAAFRLERAWAAPALTPCIAHDDEMRTRHMQSKDVRLSNAANLTRSRANVAAGDLVANAGRIWGEAHVRRIATAPVA